MIYRRTASFRLRPIATLLLVAALRAEALTNGLALTPVMGWNIYYGERMWSAPYDAYLTNVADVMHTNGMQAAGYVYVCVDDCWWSERDSNGVPMPASAKFPNGITNIIQHLHSLGLKFGLYSSAGTGSVGQCYLPGAGGHELSEVNAFAAWGVDLVKFDLSWTPWPTRDAVAAYQAAIANSGRPMVFTSGSGAGLLEWYPPLMNSARFAIDIDGEWSNVLAAIEADADLAAYAQPGFWNDPDFLFLGLTSPRTTMSEIEQQSQFAFWCMLAAPLILSLDPCTVSATNRFIVTNPELIGINQDGVQARRIQNSGGLEVWSKGASEKSVLLFNRNPTSATATLELAAVGLGTKAMVRDVWARRNLGLYEGSFEMDLPPHGTKVLKLAPYRTASIRLSRVAGELKLMAEGSPGAVYSLENSANLQEWSFSRICVMDALGFCELPTTTNGVAEFYRLRWP